MKATGMVRRIDELGRIVIPKEIRKNYKIREGDALEIFAGGDELILRKYSPLKDLKKLADNYTRTLAEALECSVLFCDRNIYIACAGTNGYDYTDTEISGEISSCIEERKTAVLNSADGARTVPLKNGGISEFSAQIIVPFIAGGDVMGGMVMFTTDKERKFENSDAKSAKVTAMLMSRELS